MFAGKFLPTEDFCIIFKTFQFEIHNKKIDLHDVNLLSSIKFQDRYVKDKSQ